MAEIRTLIAQLAAADAAAREAAARELYRLGSALGDAAVAAWRADANFAELLTGPPTVGIAVQPETFEAIHAAMGRPHLAEVPPDQDAREFELIFDTARLDILTTRDPVGGGAIARFLEKIGEGIQQVEYPTTDVDRTTKLLRRRFGLAAVYPTAMPGADGTRVNFVLAATPAGRKVLIELVESPRK
jgi:predicted NBD/HSP70 family sugar kinase